MLNVGNQYFILSITLFSLSFVKVHGLEALTTVGGAFLYGHINWNCSSGSVVDFHVEAAFRRNILSGFWKNGNAREGDILLMSEIGIGTTTFYFGDGFYTDDLKLRVTAYSDSENWVFGELELSHEYAKPSDNGRAWMARLTGCCRMESLAVQKDSKFDIYAHVNLVQSTHSPVARSLPIVTAFLQSAGSTTVQLSNIFINADDPSSNSQIEWSIQKPWNVGNAANFSAALQSFASISMSALRQVSCSTEKCKCITLASDQTTSFGIGPACLFGLLRTEPNYFLRDNVLTVEGWVKARAPGYLLSVGPNRCLGNGVCSLTQNLDVCIASATPAFQTCSVSTLFVSLNGTHVIVGHENFDRSVQTYAVSFSACSNLEVCASLQGNLLNQWVHVAVVRRTKGTAGWVSYKAFINGRLLEARALPAGSRQARASAGEVFDYSLGETTVVPGPRSGDLLTDSFADGTALTFGAKLSQSGANSFFDGELDEWRFWHGERSTQDLLSLLNRNLVPSLLSSYGDPEAPDHETRLLAVYSFDSDPPYAQTDVCTLAGLSSCPLLAMLPVFPAGSDARMAPVGGGRSAYQATGFNLVSSPAGIYYTQAAASVNSGLLVLQAPAPGYYQVSVGAALPGGIAQVPVDFVVRVVRASWTSPASETRCPLLAAPIVPPEFFALDQAGGWAGNLYAPSLTISSRVAGGVTADTDGCALDPACAVKYMGLDAPLVSLSGRVGQLPALAPVCRVQAFAGSPFQLTLSALDPDPYTTVLLPPSRTLLCPLLNGLDL